MNVLMNSFRRICSSKCSPSNWNITNATFADFKGVNLRYTDRDTVSHWLKYNDKVYPPQDASEPRRPAYVCHEMKNIKYPPKKMWYVAAFIRGMTVDEALKQLANVRKKGCISVMQTIREAQQKAVEDHNVEFKSNLWVAESYCVKGVTYKGIRRCAKGRIGKVVYRYVNYYVRLEEGTPPAEYYVRGPTSGPQLLDKWLKEIRSRKIINSL